MISRILSTETNYILDLKAYESTLPHNLRESIQRAIHEMTQGNDLICPEIRNYVEMKQQEAMQMFSEKHRKLWETVSATPYANWFEHHLLEITPVLPAFPADDYVIGVLKNAAQTLEKETSIDAAALFGMLFDEKAYYHANGSQRHHLQWLGIYLLSYDKRPWTRDALYTSAGEKHSNAAVRSLVLSLAYMDLPWVPAEDYLYKCTHDVDEQVFIKAFRICGHLQDERSMEHLRPIVKSPSAVLKGLANNKMYYPVGHAACNICPAQFAIVGTDHPELAAAREQEMHKRLRSPLSVPVEHARLRLYDAIESFEQPAPPSVKPLNIEDSMVLIAAGDFYFGVDENELRQEIFDWSSCIPAKKTYLPDYYIDRYPVTNQEYDIWEQHFSELSSKERRKYEHPGQSNGKAHRRSTFDDHRFGPDHPVVGIDWFDAWAYARWHGKELPSEQQWEKAAKGTTRYRYPWGDGFDPQALRFAGETYAVNPANILEWIILLNKGSNYFPQSTTAPVGSHPKGMSTTGVYDLCGNAWEYTSTCFFTGNLVRPAFAHFSPVELMGSREGHVVIKGGAWSSPVPLIASSYRGYDLLTDRHTEIGFRCVWNPPHA